MLGSTPSYRALLAIDIQGSAGRGDPALVDNRQTLRGALRDVLHEAGIEWADCHTDGTGDGLQLIVGRDVWKARLIQPVVPELAARLQAHNRSADPRRMIRVRLALHAGDVRMEDGEVVGGALEDLSRLLDAPPVKKTLLSAPPSATVALIVSEHFYREVVRHDYPGIDPATFHHFEFKLKETTSSGWLHLPGHTPVPSFLGADTVPTVRTTSDERQRPSMTGSFFNIAQDNAHVGQQIGHLDNRYYHATDWSDAAVRQQLADLRRALADHLTAGDLDKATYEAAEDELRAADSYLAAPDGGQHNRVVLALRRLKGLVEEIADLATKVAAAITAVRGT